MSVSDFGRVGRDAELRYTANGDAVCSVPIAVDYGRKGQDGNRPTQWYEVTLWGKTAEGLSPYLLKGKQVFFTASDLHIETFDKTGGGQGFKLVCKAVDIKFANDGSSSGAGAGGARNQRAATPEAARQPAPRQKAAQPPHDEFDDDIPF